MEVSIYIHKNLKYSNINLLKYCKEQDLEIVAVNLKLSCKNVIILCTYRSPGGNLVYFLDQLDNILNSLQNLKTEYIICVDFNINYIGVNNKKNSIRKPIKYPQLDRHGELPYKNHYYVLLSYRQYFCWRKKKIHHKTMYKWPIWSRCATFNTKWLSTTRQGLQTLLH